LRIITVIPAKKGITGASLALVHIFLGMVNRFKDVDVTVISSFNALNYPAFRKLTGRCRLILVNNEHMPSPIYWLSLLNALLREVRNGRFDFAHFSTPKTMLLMLPAILIVARWTVLTLEGDPIEETRNSRITSRTLSLIAWEITTKTASMITACSEWLRQVCIKRGIPAGKLMTIHNPVDYERFITGQVAKEKDNMLKLCVVARLDPVKNIETAIKAVATLCKESRLINIKLEIVGDGPLRRELQILAEKLGVMDCVRFLGFRHNVEDYVRASDILLMPSLYEPFGMPAAEAGAAGKPVIASKVGGLKEIVVEGETGLFFNPRNPEELAEKILTLATNHELREKMGSKAKERTLKLFTPEKIAGKMLEAYLRAVREQRGRKHR